MDGACVYEEKAVIDELTQGIQMAKQLRANLHSAEARDFLMQKILSSYDNALFVLKLRDPAGQPPVPVLPAASPPEPSISIGSPGSEVFKFDQPFSIQQGENAISKKRKGSTTWEKQVRKFSGNGLEDDTDDGYNWRKYGQKEILGAKFPRSYYRCSYSKVQKCMATKQVQITDVDPMVFEIVYKGKHTCSHSAQWASPSPPPPTLPCLPINRKGSTTWEKQVGIISGNGLEDPQQGKNNLNLLFSPSPPPPPPTLPKKHEIMPTHHHQQISPPNPGEMLSNLRANLSVDTTVLGGDTFPSPLSFPSTSSGLMDNLQQFQFPDYYDDDMWQVHSPPFFSPATSETNFFTEWGSSSPLDFLAGLDM